MTIAETLLVFAAIPAGVIAAFYGVVYVFSARGRDRRYRPDLPFTFAPVWFLAPGAKVADSAQVPAAQGGARDNW